LQQQKSINKIQKYIIINYIFAILSLWSYLNVLQGEYKSVNGLLDQFSVLRGHNWWMYPSA